MWVRDGALPPQRSLPPHPRVTQGQRRGLPTPRTQGWMLGRRRGPAAPRAPLCVWGRAVGGLGGGHLGVRAAAGTGCACSGPAADVSSADKQRQKGEDKRLLCSRPSVRSISILRRGGGCWGAASPHPLPPPLHPTLSVGWATNCRPGAVGSEPRGMRDAGFGRRGAAHGAAEQPQPSSSPPALGAAGSPPPWRRCRPSPRRSQALCPPVPRCWHRSPCPPRTQLLPAQPPDPPSPPRGSTRLAPAGLCPRCATQRAVLMGIVRGWRELPPPPPQHPDPGCAPTAAVWVCITPKTPFGADSGSSCIPPALLPDGSRMEGRGEVAAAPPKRLRAPAWPHSSAWRVLVEGGARPERGVTQPWGHSGDTCGAITRPPCPPSSSFPHSAVGPGLIPPAAAQRPPSVLRGGGGGIDPWEPPRTPSYDNRHSVTPRCSSCGHRDPAAPGGEEGGARKRRGGEGRTRSSAAGRECGTARSAGGGRG